MHKTICLICLWFLSACPAIRAESLKIGVVVPLSGPRAEAGRYVRNGLQLAKEKVNTASGRKYQLEFVFEDSAYSPRLGVTAFHNLRSIHSINYVIGGIGSSVTLALAPLAEKSGTILISPGSQSHVISQAGDYIFRLIHNTAQEAPFFADFVVKNMKSDVFHIVGLETDFTPSYLKYFLPKFKSGGKKVGLLQEFDVHNTDFRSYLLKIKKESPTDIFLLTTPVSAALALKQAKELGIKAQYYTLGIESAEFIKIAGKLTEGVLYPYSYDNQNAEPSVKKFYEKYLSLYGEPPDAIASNSYDAAVLIMDCAEEVGPQPEKVKACLYKTRGYQGAGGIFSIDQNGDAVKTLYIKTIKDGKFVHYQRRKDMALNVKWLGHASFRLEGSVTVYIDPWKLKGPKQDADLVLVSHSHYDHYSADDIAAISGSATEIVGPEDVISAHGSGRTMAPGQSLEVGGVSIVAVPAYNPNKKFHPQSNNWLGFVITIDGIKIYYAGDTDLIPEMKELQGIDLALVPVGGTYTMSAAEAVEAVGLFFPTQVIPYHWGDIVGSRSDAESFAAGATSEVTVLSPGEEFSF